MKRNWLVVVAVLCLAARCAGVTDDGVLDWNQLRRRVAQDRVELQRLGLYAFVTNDAGRGEALRIHSQCWVDRLPEDSAARRAYEQEKREFGFDVAQHLEGAAREYLAFSDVGGLKERVHRLLAVAEWLKKDPGYGNYILKKWAEDMAVGTIAQLAINKSCPINDVRSLLGRVDTYAACAIMQVAILNEESPDRWSVPNGAEPMDIQRELGVKWGRFAREAKSKLGQSLKGRRRFLFEDVKTEDFRYAFYIPDVNPGNATITRCWGLKDHEQVCVYGMYNHMRKDVEELIRCREVLGYVPIPTSSDLKDDASREEFIDKQDILWARNGRGSGVKPFGRLVVQIVQGRFMDPYTRILRM